MWMEEILQHLQDNAKNYNIRINNNGKQKTKKELSQDICNILE